MKTTEYLRFYPTESDALDAMRSKNDSHRDGALFVVTDGPEDNFAVMDLKTAIEMELPYKWESR
jgi:hypothetical protein